MKEKIINWFLFFCSLAVLSLVAYIGYQEGRLNPKYEPTPERITVDHYITDLIVDSVYLDHFDTLQYFDTVIENGEIELIIDTHYVPIPISIYEYDTTLLQGDSVETHFKATVSGFNVSMDALSIHTDITREKAVKKQNRLVPAVGFGYGTGGWGLFAGIGYRL